MEASDLVKDSELETKFFDDHLRHIFYRRGTNATDRRIRLSEKWVRNRQLGSGSFGTVWLETCKKTVRQGTPTTRAVKEIKVDPRIDITRELEAIAKFSNNKFEPCFVRSYGWFRGPESIFITMEYILHGDLRHHLRKLLPENEVKTISQQLLEGLKHMFDNRFVHRDLKPENILVVAKGPHWLVQISDFGISKRLQEGGTIQGTMRQGTLGFMAPELLGFVAEKRFPFAVDMWSLGAVAFRMFTGKQYLADYDEMREFVQGNRPFPSQELLGGGISTAGLDYLKQLLLPDPGSRMTPDTASAHEWMKIKSI
ncbi:kinase-like domain-containing protein [Podospora appendiculata]|uniref:Autophagy-related protein 1 n=1 Tax=Podospora appendiculata TaxID=314037 RepID=A0AAE0X2C5_9PEZI|nr:kinase-like domain-containing protein [Podospora appendiculata]